MRKKIVSLAFAMLVLMLPTLTQEVSSGQNLEYPTIVYPITESSGIQLNDTAYRLHTRDTLNLTFGFLTHEVVSFTLVGYYTHYYETEEGALVNRTFHKDGVLTGYTYMRWGLGGSGGGGTSYTMLGPGVLLPGAHTIEWKWLFTVDEDAEGYYEIDLYDVKLTLEKAAAAIMDIHPDASDLKSKGKWINAHIELQDGYEVRDINVSTILLNGVVSAERSKDNGKKLIVKFDRSKAEDLLSQAGELELTVTGTLLNGTMFQGSDTIKVIDKHWPEISCVMGIEVDHSSHRTVQNEAGVEAVFNEYIRYCQENHIEVFGGYGNNWRFESASPYGMYEGVKYWKVNASWFDADSDVWRLKSVFYVSQNGEAVRLLAPI